MTIPKELKELTELFEKLGAREPASWASSQINEGIPQLYRFLFLSGAWERIISDTDFRWIDAEIRNSEEDPSSPFSGIGTALKRCLDKGVDKEDIKEIVRGKQAEFLFGLCYFLGDPGFSEPEIKDIEWGLFLLDADGNPTVEIGMLHESVLDVDPTGREMRPKNT